MKASQLLKAMCFDLSAEQATLLDNLLVVKGEQDKATTVVNNGNLPMWKVKILKLARQGKTATEIAGQLGHVNSDTVSRIAREHNLKMRKTSTRVDEALAGKVLACCESNNSDVQVGVELGISEATVKSIRSGDHKIVGGTGRSAK